MSKQISIILIIVFCFVLLCFQSANAMGRKPVPVQSQTVADPALLVSSARPPGKLTPSVANEVNAAINRSLDWLASNQKEDGSWSNGDFPALTALALQAFIRSSHPAKETAVPKAVRYILSCVQTNGGIYKDLKGQKGGGLSNYNTAICMTALGLMKDPSLTVIIQNARKFIADTQHFGGDVYDGGFGYDSETQRPYADLLNTYYSAEAMNATASVEDSRQTARKRVDIDWGKTIKFIEQMQNKPDSGEENSGGFFYKPGESKAGATTNQEGVIVFRSYGSITYAGLLSLLYAEVSRDDPRVLSAFHWSARHWSLNENPGMGSEGLFFFYNIIAKSLNAYGADLLPQRDGSFIAWREELAKRLVSLQKVEATGLGYWRNDTGRFWENDPVLSTAYALIALELL